MQELIKRARELLDGGEVTRVLGWKAGELIYDREPAIFESSDELMGFVYDAFCGPNLSKYLIEASERDGRTLVFLKPCDSYSFNQLVKEHRVDRDKVYAVGVGCGGNIDLNKLKKARVKAAVSVSGEKPEDDTDILSFKTLYGDREVPYKDVLLERCLVCRGKEHVGCDEVTGVSHDRAGGDRFAEVKRIEALSPSERFSFFQNELSKCIRCNACRNVCPACSCRKCVFDSTKFDSVQKANSDSFEEKMFHIIRSFHVAGRCTDCGECSRVCPQGIPLHLFNRKFIKDINEFYGEYQAGADTSLKGPLTDYAADDADPDAPTHPRV